MLVRDDEVGLLYTVCILPTACILGEGGGGYFELADGVIDVAVLEVGSHGAVPLNKVGYVRGLRETQLFIGVNPLDKSVFGVPPLLGAFQ